MNIEKFQELVDSGKTKKEIIEYFNTSNYKLETFVKKNNLTFNKNTLKKQLIEKGLSKCITCQEIKKISEFNKSGLYKDGTQKYDYSCRKCKNKYQKNYYKQNKNSKFLDAKERRDEIRSWLFEIKKSLECNRCGYNNHPSALDFHHLNDSDKKSNISTLVADRCSKTTILKEIEKCEVLCANCHRIEHYKDYMK